MNHKYYVTKVPPRDQMVKVPDGGTYGIQRQKCCKSGWLYLHLPCLYYNLLLVCLGGGLAW